MVLAIGCLVPIAAVAAPTKKPELTFADNVLPIFREKCFRCHAGVEPKGGLNLARPSSLLTGGESGAAIRIAAAESSLLYGRIVSDEMPAAGPKLTAKEKGIIRTWINDGAKGVGNAQAEIGDAISGVELWSFQPPSRPKIPSIEPQDRIGNPIDAFIGRKLSAEGLSLAAEADRRTLLRRAYMDLIGLPPTPDEVRQFLADDRPDAYGRLVDRLLASPHYGERWGRHWLDVAGYAESAGVLFEDRPLQLIWRYRDYVIQAFNKDKPYDRFLQEQIAGDELTDYWTAYETLDRLPDEVIEGITATGFLRTAPDPSRPDFKTIKNAAAQYYYPTLFDTLQIVCSSTMGLTVQCARCHSHKYDPISQGDYYQMQAVFMNAYRPTEWIPQMERRLLIASKKQKADADKRNAEVDGNLKKLTKELAALKKPFAARLFESRLQTLPEEIRADVQSAFAVAQDKRSEVQRYLIEKFQKKLKPAGKELDQALNATFADYKTAAAELNGKVAAEGRRRIGFDEVRALYDLPGNTTTPLLLRGDPLTPGQTVEPGVISALKASREFAWSPPNETRTSGRRLAFARWLTQPHHPLTARVMANRIWLHHFGTGIVTTPEDFGIAGSPPSHPELLDWLATEFVRGEWSMKRMHRLILTSNAWRQRSRVGSELRAAGEKVDPENRLLWRQNIRRLEAEPLRDSLLAVSGSLRHVMHGSPQAVHRHGSGEVVVPPQSDQHRRSIYVKVLRLHPETMLRAFDQPDIEINCTQRTTSTVSTQALTLLNSEVMERAANAFADRVLAEGNADPARYAMLTAFSRIVGNDERTLLSSFLDEQQTRHLASQTNADRQRAEVIAAARRKALVDLCHMLLAANEFAYID